MEVVSNNYIPGDQRLIDKVVYELKSQGIFDQFRRECIADVDTKPAYQNLRQRVEGSVVGFLSKQTWKSDMNKNHVREMLRKNIHESGFLEIGVERIVDQVVNPKINSVFTPKVEEVVYKFLGIEHPNRIFNIKREPPKVIITQEDLLPTDLEAVSPESVTLDKKDDLSNHDSQDLDDSKGDEDESPPFEPIDAPTMSLPPHEEISADSHFSDISGLASRGSSSNDYKATPMEICSQDSQMSINSTDSHLSIVLDENSKMDVSESCDAKSIKSNDLMSADTNAADSNSVKELQCPKIDEKKSEDKKLEDKKDDKIQEEKKSEVVKLEKHKSDDKKSDKYKSSNSSSDRHKSRSDKDKEDKKKRSKDRERDKSSKHSSSKDRSKDRKDKSSKSEKENENKSEKSEKDKEKDKSRPEKEKNSDKYKSDKDKVKTDKHRSDKDKYRSDKNKNDGEGKERNDKDKAKDRNDKDKAKDRNDKEKADKDKEKLSKNKSDKYKDKKDKTDKDRESKDKHKSEKDKEQREKDKKEKSKLDKEKSDKSKSEKSKSDKYRSEKDRNKSDKDKKEEKSDRKNLNEKGEKSDKTSSEKADKDKSVSEKADKDKSVSEKADKDKSVSEKGDKAKSNHKSSSLIRHSSNSSNSSRDKSASSKESSNKDKDKYKSSNAKDSKPRDDKGQNGTKSKDEKKISPTKKEDRHSSSKKHKEKKKDKDEHCNVRDKKFDRRSTDRDSNDGHSGRSFYSSSGELQQTNSQKSSQDSVSSSMSGSGESGNSDETDHKKPPVDSDGKPQQTVVSSDTPSMKLMKPKFASNIYEAKRLMKIRKQLSKMERHNQLSLSNVEVSQKGVVAGHAECKENQNAKPTDVHNNGQFGKLVKKNETETTPRILKKKPNILKKELLQTGPADDLLKNVKEKLKAALKRKNNILKNNVKNNTSSLAAKSKLNTKAKNKLAKVKLSNKEVTNKHNRATRLRKKPSEGNSGLESDKKKTRKPSPAKQHQKLVIKENLKPENVVQENSSQVYVTDVIEEITPPLKDTIITMESWDALEAKLHREMLNVDYDSYESPDLDYATSPVKKISSFKGFLRKSPEKLTPTSQGTSKVIDFEIKDTAKATDTPQINVPVSDEKINITEKDGKNEAAISAKTDKLKEDNNSGTRLGTCGTPQDEQISNKGEIEEAQVSCNKEDKKISIIDEQKDSDDTSYKITQEETMEACEEEIKKMKQNLKSLTVNLARSGSGTIISEIEGANNVVSGEVEKEIVKEDIVAKNEEISEPGALQSNSEDTVSKTKEEVAEGQITEQMEELKPSISKEETSSKAPKPEMIVMNDGRNKEEDSDCEECRYFEIGNSRTLLSSMRRKIEELEMQIVKQTELVAKLSSSDCPNDDDGTSKRKGKKRKILETNDVQNNNNNNSKRKCLKEENRVTARTRRSNSVLQNNTDKTSNTNNSDVSMNHHNFSLPLSPSDSDKSSGTRKDTNTEVDTKRIKITKKDEKQRYSSDDLYKPRPNFVSTRRTRGSNIDRIN